MQHLDFIVWMLGFPIAMNLNDVLIVKAGKIPADNVGYNAVIYFTFWLGGGYLLW